MDKSSKLPKPTLEILFDRERIIRLAEEALGAECGSITDVRAPLSEGGPHDYYSNGDYWWPNPATSTGLPYVRRDGESNPGNFDDHRRLLRRMRTNVAHLAAGFALTQEDRYARKAAELLTTFFVDAKTRMNPHLKYAQAIPGVSPGRGIGIIDTLHLIDVPFAVCQLQASSAFPGELAEALKRWFADYLSWMNTHPNGLEEREAANNHGVCWFVQAAAFARFTGDEAMLAFCRERYRTSLLPLQMAENGSFPRELARTKPYGYSIFVLDNMVTLCQLLSMEQDNLWTYELADGRGIRRGLDYLVPYLRDKSAWPYPPDVEHDAGWPAQVSLLLFAGLALEREELLQLWSTLDPDPTDPEVRRNIAIRQPLLFL